MDLNLITTPRTAPTREEIKLGSETFTLVNGDDRPDTFIAGKDHVLQNGKEIDGRKFLERFGLDPQAPFQIRGLVAYFGKLEETRASINSKADFNFDWKMQFCGTLPSTLVEPCIGKSDEQLAAALFANDTERETAGLQYAREVRQALSTYGKGNMIFKYQNSQLLKDAAEQLKTATTLLGKEHPLVKELRTELSSKFEAGIRVLKIVGARVDAVVNAYLTNSESAEYNAKRTAFITDFGRGSHELLDKEIHIRTHVGRALFY